MCCECSSMRAWDVQQLECWSSLQIDLKQAHSFAFRLISGNLPPRLVETPFRLTIVSILKVKIFIITELPLLFSIHDRHIILNSSVLNLIAYHYFQKHFCSRNIKNFQQKRNRIFSPARKRKKQHFPSGNSKQKFDCNFTGKYIHIQWSTALRLRK